VDSHTDVAFLAAGVRQPQSVDIRVLPDIDLREHSSATTDLTDQTLGFALTDRHSADAIQRALEQPLLYIAGLLQHRFSGDRCFALRRDHPSNGSADGRRSFPSRDSTD
jgi:diaminopimelate decarboxylase